MARDNIARGLAAKGLSLAQPISGTIGNRLRRLSAIAGATNPLTRGVMAAPPTISNSATHLTALSVAVSNSSPVFRYIGATQAGGFFTTSVQGGTSAWAVEFMTDSPKFEIWANPGAGIPAAGAYSRAFIDGVAASLSFTNMAPSSGYTLIDFTSAGGRKMRRIRFETGNGSTRFLGLQVAPFDTVVAAPQADPLRAIFAGDSITSGTGSDNFFNAYVQTAAKYLGWDDPWASGAAGTGYINNGSSVKIATRLSADVIANSPNVVVFALGVNDVPFSTPADIQTAAAAVYATTRAALPGALIVVVGPWPRTDQTTAAQQAVSTALSAALTQADPVGVAAGKSCFIDPIAANILTGTGTDTAPAGNGNADYYISGVSGNPHPNQVGHDYYGRWLAEQIKGKLQALA